MYTEIQSAIAELEDLRWAQLTYDERQESKASNKQKKEWRANKKQYNDPYESDQYVAMKHPKSFERPSQEVPKVEPRLHLIIRQLNSRDPTFMREWELLSYELEEESVFLELRALDTGQKQTLNLLQHETIELLYRRSWEWTN
jgi:hypothetical protein